MRSQRQRTHVLPELDSSRTETSLWRYVNSSAAFEFLFVSATTAPPGLHQLSRSGACNEAQRTIEVVVSDVEVVDPLTREARRHVRALLLLLQYEGQEALDSVRRDVVAVGSLDERLRQMGRASAQRKLPVVWADPHLALEVEDGNEGARHGAREGVCRGRGRRSEQDW